MSQRNPASCFVKVALALLLLFGAVALSAAPACASPWAEVGDAQLRSDIQVLAAAGIVDGITTQWPLPWAGILEALSKPRALADQSAFVRAAATRVFDEAQAQLATDGWRVSARVDGATTSSVVYGYDGMARENAEAQVSAERMFSNTALRLSVGGELLHWSHPHSRLRLDGSYIAQTFGGMIVYAGAISQWWGPGWISALSLSNNARPFPQIGIERLSTARSAIPVLSWLGPWQFQFLVGVLDGPRIDENTLYNGAYLTFNPLPGLELGLSRTEEFCGRHHSCKPLAYYFDVSNDSQHVNKVNDEATIDIHYTGMAMGTPFEVYTQVMNEDTGPFVHSGSSHLFGASVWLPLQSSVARVTAEYTDSIATRDIFSFGDVFHGFAYNNYSYVDGMRYRGRTLGFSLDSDSRLASLQVSWINDRNWIYTLSVHRAWISTPQNSWGNIVTTAPVAIDLSEARVKFPFSKATVEIAGRLQDDQPRPKRGFEASVEAALSFSL